MENLAAISPGGWSCCEAVVAASPNDAINTDSTPSSNSLSQKMLRDTYRKVKTLRRGAQGVVYLATPRAAHNTPYISRINPNGVVAVKRVFPIYLSPDMAAVGITDVTRREVGVLRFLNQMDVLPLMRNNDAVYLGNSGASPSPFVALIDVVLAIKGKKGGTTAITNVVSNATCASEECDLGDSPCGPHGGASSSPPPSGDEVCIVMEYCPMDLSSNEGLVNRCKAPILTMPSAATAATSAGGLGMQGKFNGGMGLNLGLGGDDEDDDGCYVPRRPDNSRRTLNLGLPPKVALSLGDSSDDEDVIDFTAQFAANGADDDDYSESSDDDGGNALQIKSTITATSNTIASNPPSSSSAPPSHPKAVSVEEELLVRQSMVRLLIYQILRGVHTMHQHSILHRDIKGSNILLTTTTTTSSPDDGEGYPRVRFADFGSARSCSAVSGVPPTCEGDAEGDSSTEECSSPTLTSAVTRTTLLYRSPETLMNTRSGGSEYSYPSDMWAVGVVFAELLLSIVKPCYSVEFGKAAQNQGRGGWGGAAGGGGGGVNAHYLFQVQSEMELIGAIYKLIGPPAADTSFLKDGCGGGAAPPTATSAASDLETPQSLKSEGATLRVKFTKLTTSSGLHLLASLLCMDPVGRITAQEALSHPYFDEDAGVIGEGGDVSAVKKASDLLAQWCRDSTVNALA